MALLRAPLGLLLALLTSGCQLTYYAHSAYHQTRLIHRREPIQKVLSGKKLTEDEKRKLRLIEEAKAFGENELGLSRSRNYTSFVALDEPYVTYIVQAANAYELKPFLWSFPFVGKVPYKGYFRRQLAEAEAGEFDKNQFDTYVRGVSAYSTLGWFEDSVLSSMLRYEDHELVELILHESIHSTLYIKDAVDFNERLATFMGLEGMKLFYLKKEGPNSPHLLRAQQDSQDQKLFSAFLTEELESLKIWYEERKSDMSAELKRARLKEIQDRFHKNLRPKLKTANYEEFGKRELNNALLLALKTYQYSLEDFEKVFARFRGDFKATLTFFKSLEEKKDPVQTLKDFGSTTSASN